MDGYESNAFLKKNKKQKKKLFFEILDFGSQFRVTLAGYFIRYVPVLQ